MRGIGVMGPAPVTYADALRWCDEHNVTAPDERAVFLDAVRVLDAELFVLLREQRKRES
jgi:hypothetical protein